MSVKSKNIHVLPTDKPSKLFYNVGGALLFTDYENYNGVNIYITSHEEIKEGDWCFYVNGVYKVLRISSNKRPVIKMSDGTFEISYYKKIILTTDQDLIEDGVQAIDNEFLEWFVKNPSCESVDVDYRYDTFLQPILDSFGNKVLRIKIPTESENLSQIIIPKEFPKPNIIDNWLENNGDPEIAKQVEQEAKDLCEQETLEEVAEKFAKKFGSEIDSTRYYAFINGAKWQQEQDKNKFSEEDMKKAYHCGRLYQGREGDTTFEQFIRTI